jgi:hypothetical protein
MGPSVPADGEAGGREEEIAAVVAAAAWVARRHGVRRPAVTAVRPLAVAAQGGPSLPSPWAWAGRLDLMAARRAVQRRGLGTR